MEQLFKNNKMKQFFIAVLAVLTMASCTKTQPDETLVPIDFGTGLLISTKAPITSDGSGILSSDLSGVQILRAPDGSSAVWTSISSVASTATIKATTGAVENSTALYYNVDDSKAWVMAFYPSATMSANKAAWTITGQEDIIVAPSTDAGSKSSHSTVPLAFAHKLAQVQFDVVAADADAITYWGTVTYIKVTAATALELTLSTNALAAAGTPVNTDLSSSGTFPQTLTTSAASAGSLMVLPTTLGAVKVDTANGSEQTISVSGLPDPLVAGTAYKITLTFTRAAITMTATVTNWTTGASGTGSVS